MSFTAKDVQSLRQATGAGMMDSKKALEANDGDIEAAAKWLREQGLAASAKRSDRDNAQGVVALHVVGPSARSSSSSARPTSSPAATSSRPRPRRWPSWWSPVTSAAWRAARRSSTT